MIKSNLPVLTPIADRLKQEITLISHGYSLGSAAPDGRLTVYPWDSEISQWMLEKLDTRATAEFSAAVVGKLTRLKNDVVDKFVYTELLLIMLVARSLTDEGRISYTATCPKCRHATSESVRIPDQLGVLGKKEVAYAGFDLVNLPHSKDVLKVRPLLVSDLKAIDATKTGLSAAANEAVTSIVAVNESTPDNLADAVRYYLALPPGDVTYLQHQRRELSPGLDTVLHHRCDRCKTEFDFNLGMDYDFFRASLQ